MPAKANSMTLSFTRERETKNTVRFQENGGDEPAIGTLYVQKSAMSDLGEDVQNIQVVVSAK